MAIITLTTDWNRHDYYAGLFKGHLLRHIPDASIVELTHSITPFHVVQAAFVLRNALSGFPDGTIHLLLVNQTHSTDRWPVVAKYRSQYLVGWDDGLLELVMEDSPTFYCVADASFLAKVKDALGESVQAAQFSPSFPELMLFPMLAAYILKGEEWPPSGGGPSSDVQRLPLLPAIQHDLITGQVIYIDSYHNAITNITGDLFRRTRKNRKFEILVKSNHYRIDNLSETYHATEPGELLALINSVDLLEIAIMMGSAAELLALEPGSTIKVKFYEK